MTTENDTTQTTPASVPPVPPPPAASVGTVREPSPVVEDVVSAPAPEAEAPAASATAASATAASATPEAPEADGVRAGAVKAARAALAAAKDAAKRVQGAVSSDSNDTGANPPSVPPGSNPATGATPRADMHYSTPGGGLRFDGQQTPPTAGGPGTPGGPSQTAPARPAQPAGVSGPRRVRLTISRIDPWSVMKLAFLLAVAIGIMTVVAAAVFWFVVDGLGTFDEIQQFINQVIGTQATNIAEFVAFDRMVSLATLIAIVNIVLMTAIATIIAIIYNITAALVGGVHLTLTDD